MAPSTSMRMKRHPGANAGGSPKRTEKSRRLPRSSTRSASARQVTAACSHGSFTPRGLSTGRAGIPVSAASRSTASRCGGRDMAGPSRMRGRRAAAISRNTSPAAPGASGRRGAQEAARPPRGTGIDAGLEQVAGQAHVDGARAPAPGQGERAGDVGAEALRASRRPMPPWSPAGPPSPGPPPGMRRARPGPAARGRSAAPPATPPSGLRRAPRARSGVRDPR